MITLTPPLPSRAQEDFALGMMGVDLGSQPGVHVLAEEYLLIRAGAAPAALLVTVGQGMFRGLQVGRAAGRGFGS